MQEIGGTHAHDRYEAEVQHLVRTLRSYGVLTTERLCEASGARNWHGGTFEGALSAAVRSGRFRRLGDDLYELPDEG